jgi:hypothetical protein
MKNLHLFIFLPALLIVLSALNGNWGEAIAWSCVFLCELQIGILKRKVSEKVNHV